MAKVIKITRNPTDCTIEVGGERLVAKLDEFSPAIRDALAVLGLANKIGDAGAKPCDPATGKPQTPEQKLAAMVGIYEALKAGEWSRVRPKPAKLDPAQVTPERVAVLAKLGKTTEEKAEAWAAGRTREQLVKAFASPAFVLELARRRALGAKTEASVFEGL